MSHIPTYPHSHGCISWPITHRASLHNGNNLISHTTFRDAALCSDILHEWISASKSLHQCLPMKSLPHSPQQIHELNLNQHQTNPKTRIKTDKQKLHARNACSRNVQVTITVHPHPHFEIPKHPQHKKKQRINMRQRNTSRMGTVCYATRRIQRKVAHAGRE